MPRVCEVKWPCTREVASRVAWDALLRVRRSTSIEREYRTNTRELGIKGFVGVRTCNAGRAHLPRRMRRMCSRRATPVARERNPTAPHTQECVPNVQHRSLPHSADGGDRTHTL